MTSNRSNRGPAGSASSLPRAARPPAATPFAADPAGTYRLVQLQTATPRHLRELLYDEAVRLCRQAAWALDRGDVEFAADRFGQARTVVQHLQAAVVGHDDRSVHFAELYEQVHRRLIEADFYRNREVVAETISMLNFLRPAWLNLVGQASASGPDGAESSSGGWVG